MNSTFGRQNHPDFVASEIELLSDRLKDVKQLFTDAQLRTYKLGRRSNSGNYYDGINFHTQVREFNPGRDDIYHIRAVRQKNVIVPEDPNKNRATLWQYLLRAVIANSAEELETDFKEDVDWEGILSVIRNEESVKVAEYKQAVEDIFRVNGLDFSRNLMKKHEDVFLFGHLQAIDAWKGENINQSVRFLMDLIWRRKGMEREARELIEMNIEILEENELMIRNVKGLFARRQPDDLARVELLVSAGFQFTNVNLTKSDLAWLIEMGSRDLIQFARNLKNCEGVLEGGR